MIVSGAAAAGNPDVGGKASALSRLIEAGFEVPDFFVVIGEAGAPDLVEAVRGIGAGPYAVRSSAVAEDGAADSHAGQFDTILDVDEEGLASAIARVAASGSGEGVAAYRLQRGILDETPPAVIVQRMVAAETAGVAFSADPVSGRRDLVVVSAVRGLGDRLVAGEVDGTTWFVSRDGDVVSRSGDDDGALSAEAVAQVASLVRSVEAWAGAPQDIEWAFGPDGLKLLQARPITSPLRDAPVEDGGLSVFDNSNIVESYPGVVSPLTFSFASYAYARVYTSFLTMLGVERDRLARDGTVLDNMLSRIDGRVYYNLGNWYRALAMLPGYSLNSEYMETMMGVSSPLPQEMAQRIRKEASASSKAREWLRLARTAAGLVKEAVSLGSTARDFRDRLDRALSATAPDRLSRMSATELAAEYRRIEADLLDRWDAPIVNDFLCMIAFGASRRMMERWGGDAGLEAHNEILIGQGDIVSARPPFLIREMGMVVASDAESRAALESGDRLRVAASAVGPHVASYVAEFGDRCTEELKLESVTLDEDPSPLFAAVLASSRDPIRSFRPEAHPFADLSEVLGGRMRALVATPLLKWTMRRVRDRENLRYERTRIFGRARRLFLAIGRRLHSLGLLDDPRDVFLLTVDEVLGSIEGFGTSADLMGLADVRRREMEAALAMPDPPERIVVRGPSIGASGRAPEKAVVDDALERKATGCSAGDVTAVARVIRDPRGQSLGAGEILVARHTDPGWIALFANAAAIVVERGSLLSHSAIVARELGIPCVVGMSGATDWIRDGETVRVDGSRGIVWRTGA
jgi:pyruvate,water dikinase